MQLSTAAWPWLTCNNSNPRATLRLLCLPYAGGSAQIFRSWPELLPKTVEVCPVQLPGRGNRIREPAFTNLPSLVETLARVLLPHLDRPFALFGHSMGATIGFELARYLRKELRLEPVHLFVSGSPAPQLASVNPPNYDLPEPEFIEKLRQLNGTPQEVLENPGLMELMVALLRADFELIQTYVYKNDVPLDCRLTAFGGLLDPEVNREQLDAWREQTTTPFSMRMFPGDHFFLHGSQKFVLQAISSAIAQM